MEFERLENDANWKGKKVEVAINCNCCWFIDLFMESIASYRHDVVWLTRMSIRWWANGAHQVRACVCVCVMLWGAGRAASKKKQKHNLQLFECLLQCTQFYRCLFEVTCKSQRSNHVWRIGDRMSHTVFTVQWAQSTAAVNSTKDIYVFYYSLNSEVQRLKWIRVKERKKDRNGKKRRKEMSKSSTSPIHVQCACAHSKKKS